MDVWSHEGRSNQKQTCERISESGTSDKEDHREKSKVVRTYKDVLRRMLDTPISGKRRKWRQKTRWKDLSKREMESVGLKEEDILDRIIPATPDDGEKPDEKKKMTQLL